MTRASRAALLMIPIVTIVLAPAARAYWVPDGTTICAPGWPIIQHGILTDGAAGAIITWADVRNVSSNYDIYAQKVNALGIVQWTVNGVALTTAASYQWLPRAITDGAGGAIVAWQDERNGTMDYDIYAQRVNASGSVLWTANGVSICSAASFQRYPQIVSDGKGGAIIVWNDYRSGMSTVYAQRINASGEALWTTNGIALSTGYSSFLSSRRAITPDGAGGAIVMWNGSGAPAYVYAQKVNAAGIPQWTANGVIVGTGGNIDVVSDDEGGAIAAYDNNTWIYISRIISSGTVQWNSSVQSFNNLRYPAIASDGMHGAFVAYQADDATDLDIYAQHITASGTVAWPDSGVALFATAAYDNLGEIASDEVGGVIVTSYDNYSRGGDYNVYAQRITASGIVHWQMNGVALCTAASDQRSPVIATTGTGKAIVAWVHESNYGIHAQSIDSSGSAGTSPPAIQSVLDVPNDQGGCVRIEIARSGLDAELEPTYPVSRYDIWQRVDDPLMLGLVSRVPEGGAAAAAAIAVAAPKSDSPLAERANALIDVGWPLIESGGRFFMRSRELLGTGSFPPGTWELLGSFAATQQNEYIFRAGTLADSTASGIPYSVYIVSAHTTTPTVWYASYPDSGYSVDNLPPEAPGGLLAEQSFSPTGLALSWDLSTANDISHYAVYRGSSEAFVPSVGNRVAVPIQAEWFDGSWRWSSSYYYKISAVDIHGNESGFALVRPSDVTGSDTPKAPAASYLNQNYPNPFNPQTRIAFGLSAPGHVSLRIFDAAGRLVRVLVNEDRREGRYEEIWDGRDAGGRSVSSGIYFYRLRAGAFEATKKMILVR